MNRPGAKTIFTAVIATFVLTVLIRDHIYSNNSPEVPAEKALLNDMQEHKPAENSNFSSNNFNADNNNAGSLKTVIAQTSGDKKNHPEAPTQTEDHSDLNELLEQVKSGAVESDFEIGMNMEEKMSLVSRYEATNNDKAKANIALLLSHTGDDSLIIRYLLENTPGLEDPDPAKRIDTIKKFATFNTNEYAANQISVLLYDGDPLVRMTALEAMPWVGNESDIANIEVLLNDENALVREHVERSLETLKNNTQE